MPLANMLRLLDFASCRMIDWSACPAFLLTMKQRSLATNLYRDTRMSDQQNKQEPSRTETVSSPPEGITLRDKQMAALNMLLSVLDNSASLLKLYFGLQTGAIVLFVKVLTDVRAPTLVLTTLAISIFLFGVSALICLSLLIGLLEMRANMVSALVDDRLNWHEAFDAKMREWQQKMARAGKAMAWMFRLAILFA